MVAASAGYNPSGAVVPCCDKNRLKKALFAFSFDVIIFTRTDVRHCRRLFIPN
jgi:hypothetical protein